VGTTVAAIVVAVGAVACAASDPDRRRRSPERPPAAAATRSPSMAPAPAPSRRTVFVPPVRRERGRLVMPLAFPDGSTAELIYPPKLDLAAMGIQPDVSFLRRDRPATRFPLVFWFGQPGAELVEGDQPLERYPTSSGDQAELWRAGAASSTQPRVRHWLVFRLASWTVLAPAATPATAAELVRALNARETGDGYVRLEARHPLALSREPGEGGGPQLAIGDGDPRPEAVKVGTPFRLIILSLSRNCRPEGISPSGQYASTCLGTTGSGVALFAGIDGDRSFVKDVFAGLEARNIQVPS
jgi:hypothetical protein